MKERDRGGTDFKKLGENTGKIDARAALRDFVVVACRGPVP